MVAMEDMEVFTTDHMAASEDALLEHSVILECVDVKGDMKQDMDPASTTPRALEGDHMTIDSLPITTLTSAVARTIKSV